MLLTDQPGVKEAMAETNGHVALRHNLQGASHSTRMDISANKSSASNDAAVDKAQELAAAAAAPQGRHHIGL